MSYFSHYNVEKLQDLTEFVSANQESKRCCKYYMKHIFAKYNLLQDGYLMKVSHHILVMILEGICYWTFKIHILVIQNI